MMRISISANIYWQASINLCLIVPLLPLQATWRGNMWRSGHQLTQQIERLSLLYFAKELLFIIFFLFQNKTYTHTCTHTSTKSTCNMVQQHPILFNYCFVPSISCSVIKKTYIILYIYYYRRITSLRTFYYLYFFLAFVPKNKYISQLSANVQHIIKQQIVFAWHETERTTKMKQHPSTDINQRRMSFTSKSQLFSVKLT